MGMYDTLYVSIDKLPISNEEKSMISPHHEWQTKAFDCCMTEIYITDDGDLKIERWELEEVPKHERKYPNDEGLLGLAGSLRRVNSRLETILYHGVFNFYSYINEKWYEFTAKFTDGKLVSIHKISNV